MSKIVLGTVQFGINYGINNSSGQVSSDEVITMLKIAEEKGIKALDTSSAYGNSEIVLGKALKESGTKFKIISKYPRCEESVHITFEKSINNLGVDSLYGYLVHHFEFYQDHPDIFKEMRRLKEEGYIQKIGFSLYNPQQLQYLYDHNVQFDILQFPYNIFDRQFEPFMERLYNENVEIHTRSAFLQGLFFKDINTLPDKLIPLKPYLNSLHNYCTNEGVPIEQIALDYVLANKYVKGALIGVDNHIQLESNLKVASHHLNQKDIVFIKTLDIKEKDLLNPVNWK